jgi:glycosyltransferase involved in cell wall biosynthesis
MKISVIIPTYNRSKMLAITLDSFIDQNYPKGEYEIIISNNNSTDDTAEVIEKYLRKHTGVRIAHHFEKRQGVHYARNLAGKAARGEILYFTDDDMVADPDLLQAIIKPFMYNEKVASVGGKVLPLWLSPPPLWIKRLCNNNFLSLRVSPFDLRISDISEAASCHEAVLKDAFIKAGGFNPENTEGVWVGDGESGLGHKMKELGYKSAYTSEAITYHMIPPERMTQAYLNKRLYNQGCSDAYAFYKYTLGCRLDRRILLFYSNYLKAILKSILGVVFYPQNLRFCLAYSYAIVASLKYFRKLHYDSDFRDMVKKSDWID